MVEIRDERKCWQRHQRHRHRKQTLKIQTIVLPPQPQCREKQIRMSSRSSKRNELIEFEKDFKINSHLLDNCSTKRYDNSARDNDIEEYDGNLPYSYYYTPSGRNIVLCDQEQNSTTSHLVKTRHKHTMLTRAIEDRQRKFAEILLQRVLRGSIYPTIIDHVCSNGRSALWHACKIGDLDLVRQLIERCHAHISKCGVLIVASQSGHDTIVQYLLHKGCDPNRRAKNYNEFALHAASRRNHLRIVELLLSYGADPTLIDYKKRTALDYAIHKRHVEIAKTLIRYQKGKFKSNEFGFTPLMQAVHFNKIQISDLLMDILPRQQVLDELLLLACKYTIDGYASREDQAYCYFEKALNTTIPFPNVLTNKIYESCTECQTVAELAAIRDDDNAMRMHALLVSERLSIASGEMNFHFRLLMKQSYVYRRQRLLHHCLHLRLHAYELASQLKYSNWKNPKWHREYLSEILCIFSKLLRQGGTISPDAIKRVWKWILDRSDNTLHRSLFQLLTIVTYLIDLKKTKDNGFQPVFKILRQTIVQNFTFANGHSYLMKCVSDIKQNRPPYKVASYRVPIISVMRLLIMCGADVNEVDSCNRSTPLHLLASCGIFDVARPAMELLLNAGAHIDCIDGHGHRPEDRANFLEMKMFIRDNQKLLLKCSCARLIGSANICYTRQLSSRLINFVRMHSSC